MSKLATIRVVEERLVELSKLMAVETDPHGLRKLESTLKTNRDLYRVLTGKIWVGPAVVVDSDEAHVVQ